MPGFASVPLRVRCATHGDAYVFPQLDALEFLHENEYVHGNVTAENIFVNPEDLSQVRAGSSPAWGFSGLRTSSVSKLPFILQCLLQTKNCYPSYIKSSSE